MKTASSWYSTARLVVETKSATKTDEGILLDLFTASMLTTVFNALNETNATRFAALPLDAAVEFGWKVVSLKNGA